MFNLGPFSMDLTFLYPALMTALPFIFGGGFCIALMWYLSRNINSPFNAYKGIALEAIHLCEAGLDAHASNPTMSKVDRALHAFSDLWEASVGKTPSDAAKDWFTRVRAEVLHDIAIAQLSGGSTSTVTGITNPISMTIVTAAVPKITVVEPPVMNVTTPPSA